MSYFDEDDDMLRYASEALQLSVGKGKSLSSADIKSIAGQCYKELPFGMKAVVWGAGLYAIIKTIKFGTKIIDKFRGPKQPKNTFKEDREELLKIMTEWWKKPTMQYNEIHPATLLCGFDIMYLKPIDVIRRCESNGDMPDFTLKSLWEFMYRGEVVSEDKWNKLENMEDLKKLFANDRFRIIAGHDDYFYAYSAQKKKIYEFIATHDESFKINEVETFMGSNENGIYDTSKITVEDISNVKLGRPVAPLREDNVRSAYKVV